MATSLVGRRRELAEIARVLERASHGTGDVVVLTGPPGIGKTALADAAVSEARSRQFAVLRASGADDHGGQRLWAQLLHDVGAPEGAVSALTSAADAGLADDAARFLVSDELRLIVVEDIDRGGGAAIEMLGAVARRANSGRAIVIATARTPLGIGREVRVHPLSEEDTAAVIGGELAAEIRSALWIASGGVPGTAVALAEQLQDLAETVDPIVHVALHSESRAAFLEVDAQLVRLLEVALERAGDDASRARLLARLAYELLGDAAAGGRRRALVDEALTVARRSGDRQALLEVLDARLHALWDPAGAEDRLAAADEIVALARMTGDAPRERQAVFWRFIALMELARVSDAESALAAYARAAEAAADPPGLFMVRARQAMVAILRGRFDDGTRLAWEVNALGRRAAIADTERLVGTLLGAIGMQRDLSTAQLGLDMLRAASVRMPGHLFEATAARILLALGRVGEAGLELQRVLSPALASSGPRWVASMTDLAAVAAGTHNTDAARRLYAALTPHHGRLAIFGGANTVNGPVDLYLGLLATELGEYDTAVGHLEAASELCEEIGALPFLAYTLSALGDTLSVRGTPQDLARAAQLRRRARTIAEELGMTALLDTLRHPADEWSLMRDGEDWSLEAGNERVRLRDSRGIHYLRALIAVPGREISALDLAAGGAGLVASHASPVIDHAALAAYRRRIEDLDGEIDAAERSGDSARAERADAEHKALLAELRRARGLGGRVRDASPEAERARVNVTRTLQTTLERIGSAAPRAGAHLRASIRTGRSCRYEPVPGGPNRWHV